MEKFRGDETDRLCADFELCKENMNHMMRQFKGDEADEIRPLLKPTASSSG